MPPSVVGIPIRLERGIDGMGRVVIQRVRGRYNGALGIVNIDISIGPFVWDARIDAPVPVRKPPNIGCVFKTLAEIRVRGCVFLHNPWEEGGKKLLVESEIWAMPCREGGHC